MLLKMVNKKQTKIAVELIAKRGVICIRPTIPQEKKNLKRKKKISRAKKVRSVKEERSCPFQGIPFKKKMSEQLQVSTATLFLEKRPTNLHYFQQNKFWVEMFKRLKDHFHPVRERRPRWLKLLPKNSIAVHNKSGRKKNKVSEEEE